REGMAFSFAEEPAFIIRDRDVPPARLDLPNPHELDAARTGGIAYERVGVAEPFTHERAAAWDALMHVSETPAVDEEREAGPARDDEMRRARGRRVRVGLARGRLDVGRRRWRGEDRDEANLVLHRERRAALKVERREVDRTADEVPSARACERVDTCVLCS